MTQENNIRLYNETKALLSEAGETIDICSVDGYETNAVGCWELRYLELDEVDEPVFESQNIHDVDFDDEFEYGVCGAQPCIDGGYRQFHWAELSDSDKEEIPVAICAYLKAEREGKLLY